MRASADTMPPPLTPVPGMRSKRSTSSTSSAVDHRQLDLLRRRSPQQLRPSASPRNSPTARSGYVSVSDENLAISRRSPSRSSAFGRAPRRPSCPRVSAASSSSGTWLPQPGSAAGGPRQRARATPTSRLAGYVAVRRSAGSPGHRCDPNPRAAGRSGRSSAAGVLSAGPEQPVEDRRVVPTSPGRRQAGTRRSSQLVRAGSIVPLPQRQLRLVQRRSRRRTL